MTTSPPLHILIQLVQQAIKKWAISCNNECWLTLFVVMVHTSMQYFIYTSNTDSFSIYVGYVTMLSASQVKVLTLHAIQ